MRKMSTVFACVAVLAMVTVASAGNINLAFVANCPGTSLPAFNATLGNPTLYIAPTDFNANCATLFGVAPTVTNYDRGSLQIMMDVQCRADGVGNEIVSSMGLNIRKGTASGPDGTGLAAVAGGFAVNTTAGLGATGTGATAGPWSSPSPNTPTYNAAGGLLVQNSRAVAVPASTTDALWTGYSPNRDSAGGQTNAGCGAGGRYAGLGAGGHYRLARLDVVANTGATNTKGHLPTTFPLFMQVGALKITRVYDPTAGNGGAPENVSFGVTGGEATVSGSTPNAESTNADAFVTLLRKGDFGGTDANGGFVQVPDGNVNSADIVWFNIAVTTPAALQTAIQRYTGDFGGTDANGGFVPTPDCVTNSADIVWFNKAVVGHP